MSEAIQLLVLYIFAFAGYWAVVQAIRDINEIRESETGSMGPAWLFIGPYVLITLVYLWAMVSPAIEVLTAIT